MQLVKDIGEQGLLAKLQLFCDAEIVGDDGAILALQPKHQLVVTTDVLVDQIHFCDRTTTAFDVGWRAAAANLSDLAAMGASPLGITVGLALPGEVTIAWVEELYQGLFECLQQFNTPIVGGDLCRSSVTTVSITALGEVTPDKIIRRSNAQVGDAVVITGYHGLSRAGLELLLNPTLGKNLDRQEKEFLIQAHQKPQPRLDVISKLQKIDCSSIEIAGMDSSDGLADAIVQICRSSKVGAIIEANTILLQPSLFKLVDSKQVWEWILYGGEDFELVLCLPFQFAQALINQLNTGAAIIGQITAEEQVVLTDSNKSNFSQVLTLAKGFQHF
ncbi:thiamine-phosphate kinase [Stanieria cyanosphaera PCC 7437]|uniref:Thiamine-monophosphate kinase n=1 Tax=Stanieria cyanosphaera (strain ATCC 29371 / PCC 7437) TaxID=111780 RepID=K9XYF5_STAC7|nr:thiamine-phosphate kinase [Stanieria cyanosphaera]AFZ37630.1 thiamine-phosphate kinase [Stanieria cyanosphaera PCC 7437]